MNNIQFLKGLAVNPINYVKSDWKYLIILDACRFDSFEKVIKKQGLFEGKLHEVDSGATHTDEWYHVHWKNADKSNIHLITSNAHPFLSRNIEIAQGFKTATKAWWTGIDPNFTFNRFLQVQEAYPDDRFIIHFTPPHLPFISESGQQLMKVLKDQATGLGSSPNVYHNMQKWAKENGWDKAKEIYEDQILFMLNLLWANKMFFKYGKMVITADHAELIGEGGLYNHPPRSEWDKVLRRVPYFEVTN